MNPVGTRNRAGGTVLTLRSPVDLELPDVVAESRGRYLDLGADAILMPDLKTPEEAAAFVAAATFNPKGTRSSTGTVEACRPGYRSRA